MQRRRVFGITPSPKSRAHFEHRFFDYGEDVIDIDWGDDHSRDEEPNSHRVRSANEADDAVIEEFVA